MNRAVGTCVRSVREIRLPPRLLSENTLFDKGPLIVPKGTIGIVTEIRARRPDVNFRNGASMVAMSWEELEQVSPLVALAMEADRDAPTS